MAKFSKPLQFSETRSGLAALNQANQEAELKGLSKQIAKLGGSAVERSSLGRDGVERRDLGETIKATSQALNRLQTEQRYTDGYGKDWREVRIGKAGWTVPEYEKAVTEKYQALVDRGHAIADSRYDAGRLREGLNKNQVVGQEMDDFARRGLRAWAKEQGIPEGAASNLLQVNRRQYYIDGSRNYSIPDVRVGGGTVILDASMSQKTFSTTPQVRNFLENSPSKWTSVFIIRPNAIGGSYPVTDYTDDYKYRTPSSNLNDTNHRPRIKR